MPYQQETLDDLKAQLRGVYDSAPFWTSAEATRYINQALRWWNLLTGMWRATVIVATPAGSPYVSLPTSLTYGAKVTWGATGRGLQLSALWDLDCARRRWEEEQITDGGDVPTVPTAWAPVGLTQFAIWPHDPVGGNPLLVDGIAATPVLVNGTDYVDIGAQDATAIVKLAFYISTFKRGAGPLANAAPYLQEFIRAAADQNSRILHSAYFRKYLGLDQQRSFRPVVAGGGARGASSGAVPPAGGQPAGGEKGQGQ